eukprot:961556_1
MTHPQQMGKRSYTWTITDGLLMEHIKSANNGQEFKSPAFTMFNFRWYLQVFPNGQSSNSIGKSTLYIYLTALPSKIRSIRISRRYSFAELNVCGNDKGSTMTHEKMYATGWRPGTVTFQDLQKCRKFTFKVDVELLAVFNKDDSDITNRYLQHEEIKTDSPASSQDTPLKTAVLDSIVMQIEQINTKINAMQQKMN